MSRQGLCMWELTMAAEHLIFINKIYEALSSLLYFEQCKIYCVSIKYIFKIKKTNYT